MSQTEKTGSDRERLYDMMDSEDFLTGCYNSAANTATSAKIRDELLTLLTEEHQIQSEWLDELAKRGWYTVEEAPVTKITQVRQTFMAALSEL